MVIAGWFSSVRKWLAGEAGSELRMKVGQKTITGKRPNNEDNLYIDPKQRYFLVADGMGGQSAGEKASALAMEIVPKRLDRHAFERATVDSTIKAIDEAIAAANSEILALGELDPRWHNMGTTITFVVSAGRMLLIGGVGDSRTYLLRGQELVTLTKDHSLVQALLDSGTITAEEALTHRYRNVLYRFLGEKSGGEPTTPRQLEPEPNDRLVLCTDGVTGGVSDDQLGKLLASSDDPQQIADAIVQAALDGGSQDNITCVVLIVQ